MTADRAWRVFVVVAAVVLFVLAARTAVIMADPNYRPATCNTR